MKNARWIVFLFTALCLVTSCAEYRYRCGDGNLTDRGLHYDLLKYKNRYVLDLGSVELHKKGSYTYSLMYLPDVEFTLGLEITDVMKYNAGQSSPAMPLNPRIKLSLMNEKGVTLAKEVDGLRNWVWSALSIDPPISFVYHYRAGKGHSSDFTPRKEETYTLVLDVLEADKNAADYKIRLLGLSN